MSDVEVAPAAVKRRRSLLVFLPLIFFLGLALLFKSYLRQGYNAADLPSVLLNKPVPTFALGPVPGLTVPGLASADLKAGKVTVVNVFASWCVPCHQEHATLLLLQSAGVNLVGIAYKDEAENTRRFLGQDGNPYKAVGADTSGRTGIDFGVYGVPETYIVNGAGTITAKIVGPLSEEIVRDQLMPAIAKAKV
jgi:cytochrome c biogenesis protein CcmG/thiol:disulfide interchange protein DsbE